MQQIFIERILNKYPKVKETIIPTWFQELFPEFSFDEQIKIIKEGIINGDYTNFSEGEEITVHYHNFQEASICLDNHYNPFSKEEKQQILMHILLDKPEIIINNTTDKDYFADVPNDSYLAPKAEEINIEKLINEVASEKNIEILEQPFSFISTEYEKMSVNEKQNFIQKNHKQLKEKVSLFAYNINNIATAYEIQLLEDVIFTNPVDVELAKTHFKKINAFLGYSGKEFKEQQQSFFSKIKTHIYCDEEMTCQWLYTEKATQLKDIPKEHTKNKEILDLLLKKHKLEDMMLCGLIKVDFLKDLENIKLTVRSGQDANKEIASAKGVAEYYCNRPIEELFQYLVYTENYTKVADILCSSKEKMKLWGNYALFSSIFKYNSNCIIFNHYKNEIMEQAKDCIKIYINEIFNQDISESDTLFLYEASKKFPGNEANELQIDFLKKLPIARKNFPELNDIPITDEFIEKFAFFAAKHIRRSDNKENTYHILLEKICINKESQDKLLHYNKDFLNENLINLEFVSVKEFIAFHNENNTLSRFSRTSLPTSYLMNKEFCLALITNDNANNIHKIPKKFFTDLDFIESALNSIPVLKSVNQQLLMSKMPEGVNKILLDKPDNVPSGTFFRKKLENHILLKKIKNITELNTNEKTLTHTSTFKI